MATVSRYEEFRVRYDQEERDHLVAEFKRSGSSIAAFAREHSLSYTTFCGWLRRPEYVEAAPQPDFVEVELEPGSCGGEGLRVEVGSRTRLQISSAQEAAWAGRLIAAYEKEVSC